MKEKLDMLAFGAHPDDVELGCGGTILKHIYLGKKVGIVDLTRGELGTRGSADIRDEEAANASEILEVEVRVNLGMADGFFQNDKAHQLEVIKTIRQYQPEIVLTNAPYDRHPDHGRGSQLVSEACFLAGLAKIETDFNGQKQDKWRPKSVYHYIQYRQMKPDIIVDISPFMEKKLETIKAFASQFYDPNSKEPKTVISSPDFLDFVIARARSYGGMIGVKYAEAYTVERPVGTNNLFDLI
ncbi:MAG: bacillithiol biosynthesis deacetylase BshB1 [Flavobacteriales bacterium]|nr:MAG: bacillithiol biosynthesis deacetylase BshB1 [Flavobacteriales bacterium]